MCNNVQQKLTTKNVPQKLVDLQTKFPVAILTIAQVLLLYLIEIGIFLAGRRQLYK